MGSKHDCRESQDSQPVLTVDMVSIQQPSKGHVFATVNSYSSACPFAVPASTGDEGGPVVIFTGDDPRICPKII